MKCQPERKRHEIWILVAAFCISQLIKLYKPICFQFSGWSWDCWQPEVTNVVIFLYTPVTVLSLLFSLSFPETHKLIWYYRILIFLLIDIKIRKKLIFHFDMSSFTGQNPQLSNQIYFVNASFIRSVCIILLSSSLFLNKIHSKPNQFCVRSLLQKMDLTKCYSVPKITAPLVAIATS